MGVDHTEFGGRHGDMVADLTGLQVVRQPLRRLPEDLRRDRRCDDRAVMVLLHQPRHPARRTTGRNNRAGVTRRPAGGSRRPNYWLAGSGGVLSLLILVIC